MGNCAGVEEGNKANKPAEDLEAKQLLNKAQSPSEETKNLRNANGESPPEQWPGKGTGAGQFEYQGYDTWTEEEKKQWKEGRLRCKWAFGQVSIRLPIHDCLSLTALVYGYLPFVIPIWWAIWVITSKITNGSPRFFPLYGLLISIGFALINETITKQICRRVLDKKITNRPPEAVCNHPGMPSGHVMNAFTLMTWCFLEAVADMHIYPEWLFAVILILGPVPWARVHNKDHTIAQVTVSGCIAVVMGITAFCLRKAYFQDHEFPWVWWHVTKGIDNMAYM